MNNVIPRNGGSLIEVGDPDMNLPSPTREAFRRRLDRDHEVKATDPQVVSFMEGYEATKRRAKELDELCQRQIVTISVAERKIEFLEQELHRTRIRAETLERGNMSLEIQIENIALPLLRILEASRDAKLRSGVEMKEQRNVSEMEKDVEAGIAALAEKFKPRDLDEQADGASA